MKTLEERQELFNKLIGKFEYTDDKSEIYIWENYLNYYAKDDEEIKTKINNTLRLVNEARDTSKEAFENFLDRDIETDLWYNT